MGVIPCCITGGAVIGGIVAFLAMSLSRHTGALCHANPRRNLKTHALPYSDDCWQPDHWHSLYIDQKNNHMNSQASKTIE